MNQPTIHGDRRGLLDQVRGLLGPLFISDDKARGRDGTDVLVGTKCELLEQGETPSRPCIETHIQIKDSAYKQEMQVDQTSKAGEGRRDEGFV